MTTYKIVGRKGTVNHIKTAENERETDSRVERDMKRKQAAIQMMDRWLMTYFQGDNLMLVECDDQGLNVGDIVKARIGRHR